MGNLKYMSKNKSYSELMTKTDQEEQDKVWEGVMQLAIMYEDDFGFSRDTVLEALLDATLDLAMKRPDERLMRHMNDVRRFYLYASELTKRHFDTYPTHIAQEEAEKIYGKDLMYLRDSKNFDDDSK
jgi:hypothetical protein